MKKLLSLVVLASAIGLIVGCEDKKSTGGGGGPPKTTSAPSGTPSTGTPSK